MPTLVRFRTESGEFAIPVEFSREVCVADVAPAPETRHGMAGMMRWGSDIIPVLTSLGAGSRHVLVLDAGEGPFGLLVSEVTEVVSVSEGRLMPPPRGHDGSAVVSVINLGPEIIMVVDAKRLWEVP
jgi:chemotaxis signal transduction protein